MNTDPAPTNRSAVKLAVLTAAIGTGFGGAAHAAFISTDASGPLLFSTDIPSSPVSIDLNTDGIADFTFGSSGGTISFNGLHGTTTDTVFGDAKSYSSQSAFTPGGSKPLSTATFADSTFAEAGTTASYFRVEFQTPDGTQYAGYATGAVGLTALRRRRRATN